MHCKIINNEIENIYLRQEHCKLVNLTVLRFFEETETDPELNLTRVIEGEAQNKIFIPPNCIHRI